MAKVSSAVIDLTLSKSPTTPQETFTQLAGHCVSLGVDKQDVYGDFGAPAGTSWLDRFEAELSEAVGKEKGIFLPSGVMAQQIALLIHKKSSAQGEKQVPCPPSSGWVYVTSVAASNS